MRMTFMAYLEGNIDAVNFYCFAFNAKSKNCFKHSNNDAFYAHAEIAINEQTVLAISEKTHYDMEFMNGNTMQLCLSFDDEKSLHRAYDV